jgi:AcrR family transcriptional regulator
MTVFHKPTNFQGGHTKGLDMRQGFADNLHLQGDKKGDKKLIKHLFKSNICLILCSTKISHMEYNDKQVQIMEAAEKLFADKGFEGTSVRDIAEKASVNMAMISYYFGSKEKMMEAMFSYRFESYKLQLVTMINNRELGPFQKMETLIDQYIDKIMNQQCFHRVMVREQMVNNNGFIARQLMELKKRNLELIKQLINEGQKKGVFRKQIDIPLLMMTLIGTISQLLTTQHYYKEINGLQEMTDEEFQKHIRKKLSLHLKNIFKAILTYEA